MLKYISLMVTAYRNATGKSVEEALTDLAISGIVQPTDFEDVAPDDLLRDLEKDDRGLQVWLQSRSGANQ